MLGRMEDAMPSRSMSQKADDRRTAAAAERRMLSQARGALETTLSASMAAYRRTDFLRAFHRLSPETIRAETAEAATAVLRELERALRAERARAGHWTYDLDRHIGLLVAYRTEQARAERIAARVPADACVGRIDRRRLGRRLRTPQ